MHPHAGFSPGDAQPVHRAAPRRGAALLPALNPSHGSKVRPAWTDLLTSGGRARLGSFDSIALERIRY